VSAAVVVDIESLDPEGRGVARRDGKVTFVAGALPAERVRAEVVRARPAYDTARLLEVQRESSQRTLPACPHFGMHPGACGGCSIQHLHGAAQVAVKQRALEDALWHIGRLRPELLLRAISGPAWAYRHRARLSVRFVARKGGVLVGFHERASSYVADMRACAILPAHVGALIAPLRELVSGLSIRARLPQIEVAVEAGHAAARTVLVLRVLQPPSAADVGLLSDFAQRHGIEFWLQPGGPDSATPLSGSEARLLRLDLPEFGVSLPFGPTDFTQVNPHVNEVLVRRAVRLLAPEPGDRVVDFFCGLGNFTLPLARRAARVVGIEGSRGLVERARQAAAENGLADTTRFLCRNLFEWRAEDWDELADDGVDRVLLDPPREGALAVVRALAAARHSPRRLVYVSCSPATLARDCALLHHEAGWTLKAAGVVNMFPQTSHVESLAVLDPPGVGSNHGAQAAALR
jgi:23S rRNA (uracil1939-C5)-methyltransferase